MAKKRVPTETSISNAETFFDLGEFLEMYEPSVGDPEDAARQLFEKFSATEITVQLFKRYRKVPLSMAELLIVNSNDSPLQKFRTQIDSFKAKLKQEVAVEDEHVHVMKMV